MRPLRVLRALRLIAAVTVLGVLATGCTGPGAGSRTVEAIVPSSVNLFVGSGVQVLGMPVGTVTAMTPHEGAVRVTLSVDADVDLPADVGVLVMPTSALGERVVALHPAHTGGPTLPDGAVIPLERAAVPAEVDEVLASLERFLAALDPDRLGALVSAVAGTIEGQGEGMNTMIAEASAAVGVLADSSDDLVGAITELAALTATLAERNDRLGPILENLSAVLRAVGEESDAIVAAVRDLHRLTTAVAPLVAEHADPLVTDLGVLATSMATVERNLDRVQLTIEGAHRLFEAGGRAFDYTDAFLALDNQDEALQDAIRDRLSDRLVGVCIRLGHDACASPEFWAAYMPQLLCVPGLGACPERSADLGETLRAAIAALPPEVRDELPVPSPPSDGAGPPPAPAPPPAGDVSVPGDDDPTRAELDELVERLLRGEPRR
jgi:phospholipid/cholesterol/gamma-HCH transport system substrate-binding protein